MAYGLTSLLEQVAAALIRRIVAEPIRAGRGIGHTAFSFETIRLHPVRQRMGMDFPNDRHGFPRMTHPSCAVEICTTVQI